MKAITALLIFCVIHLSAQTKNTGIYKTAADYAVGNLSIFIDCSSHKDKIKLHDFGSKNYIDIIKDGKDYRFYKDSIYGYRNCKQEDYRFYKIHDKEYQIVENKTILIYKTDVYTPSSSGRGMGQLLTHYFFSVKPDGVIKPLTVFNLEKAFPDNLKFHDKLNMEFSEDEDPSAYDAINKMYRVNYLLIKSNY